VRRRTEPRSRRWRAALCAALLACAIAAVAAAPAGAQSPRPRLLVAGDSLAVGTKPYLPRALRGWRIRTSAAVSRHADQGAELLDRVRRLPDVIAVSLGTNDDPRQTSAFETAIDEVMDVAGEQRCVVWANIVRPPAVGTSYAGMNAVLEREAAGRPNLRIVDWVRLARHHKRWFGHDGVHVSAAGYRARARAFARAVRGCAADLGT
jgi:lysophospholipase L1-like esterase